MNNGAFGENFPYSNYHDLNMDWIIKIAKDFLDQYTHIQELIENGEQSLTDLTNSGLEQLQDKADALETLLQEWYDTHSEDIADQLADALASINSTLTSAITTFQNRAFTIGQEVIESIPADYTEVTNDLLEMQYAVSNGDSFLNHGAIAPFMLWYQQACSGDNGSVSDSTVQIRSQALFVGKGNYIHLTPASGYLSHVRWYNNRLRSSFVSSRNSVSGLIKAPADYVIVAYTTDDFGHIATTEGNTLYCRLYSTTNSLPEGWLYCPSLSADPSKYVNVDLNTKIIRFGDATTGNGRVYLRTGKESLQVGGKYLNFSSSYSLENNPFIFFLYNLDTEQFEVIDAGTTTVLTLPKNHVYIGSIWGGHPSVNINAYPFYFVNGAKTYTNDTRGTFDALRSYGNIEYNIAVLGDSTSTYTGISESEIGGRAVREAYYPTGNVDSSDKMWWSILRNMLRFKGEVNVSAISRSMYYNTIDSDGIYAPAVWNTDRINRLIMNETIFPHYIFVLAGTNDGYVSNATGTFSYNNIEGVIDAEQLSIARGIELTITKIQNRNPYARIILLIPWAVKKDTANYVWESYYKMCELAQQIGSAYGVYKIIDLRKCGITESNVSTYTIDGTHPNANGMKLIAGYIYNCLTDEDQAIRL